MLPKTKQSPLTNQPPSPSPSTTFTDTNPSQILGTITANGRIVLLNPNGFYFGATSSVSAHTFIAAATNEGNTTYNSLTNTLSIINNDAINGNITNDGTITANKTQLIAKRVVNNASATINGAITITATQDASLHGTLSATGNNSNIDIFSNGSIRGSVDTTSTNTTFNATGELSLSGTHTATNTLTLTASPLFLESTVILNAANLTITSPNSFALISATINAHTQFYTANTTLSLIGATINSNAGTITIGNKTTPTITINDTTTISSNATGTTNAGDIIIFSADHTQFYGTATATAEHGDGGLIELSSKGTITHSTPLNISTTSTYGTTGTLLIDPANILIADPSTFNTFNSFRALLTDNPGVNPNALAGGVNAQFGTSVALTTTHALIGARLYDYTGSNSGNAFLYNLFTNTWINLLASDGAPAIQAGWQFGTSVALSSTHALIGAFQESYAGLLSLGSSGNAYLYNLSGGANAWVGDNGLLSVAGAPAPQGSAWFGWSVALSSTHALIGARFYDYTATNTGNAYLYEIGATTNAWTGTSTAAGANNGLLSVAGAPAPQATAGFGESVALSSTHALIGAPGAGSDAGNAYLYEIGATTNAWTGTSTAAGQSNGLISIDGAPSVGGNDNFGSSVALSTTHALIGAYLYDYTDINTGNAFLYEIGATTNAWTGTTTAAGESNGLLSTASPSFAQGFSQFGWSVALSETHALIGVNEYDYPGSGANATGNAYLYNISGNTWTGTNGLLSTAGRPLPQADAEFGFSVALSATHALIGAPFAEYPTSTTYGNAYFYDINGGADAWINLLDDAATTGPVSQYARTNARFGNSVALTDTHALIGANSYGFNNSGNAFLYSFSTGTWTNLLSTTSAPTPQAGSNFGQSVALSSTHALIGAHTYDYSTIVSGSGNAFLYNH